MVEWSHELATFDVADETGVGLGSFLPLSFTPNLSAFKSGGVLRLTTRTQSRCQVLLTLAKVSIMIPSNRFSPIKLIIRK